MEFVGPYIFFTPEEAENFSRSAEAETVWREFAQPTLPVGVPRHFHYDVMPIHRCDYLAPEGKATTDCPICRVGGVHNP